MSKQTTTLDPQQELDAARRELHELHIRIADGDATITPDDLDAAERRVRFTQARIDHAAEADARRKAQADAERVAELRASLPAICDTTTVDRSLDELEHALAAYLDATAEHHARMSDAWNELSRIGEPFGVVAMSGTGEIVDRESGTTYHRPDPKHELERIIVQAWRATYPRSASPFSR